MTERSSASPGFALIVSILMAAVIALGGATSGAAISSLIARLICIGLLAYCLARPRLPTPAAKVGLALLLAMAVYAIAQAIPLPPSVWSALPGREFLVDTYRQLGIALPSLPLSLTPDGPWNVLAGLSVPAAAFLVTIRLDSSGRLMVLAAVLLTALASLILAGAQVAGGADSPLRFYEITNLDAGVGVFANRNHQAALLVCAIPVAVIWTIHICRRWGVAGAAAAAVCIGVLVLLSVGLGVTKSRAGVLLGAMALAGGALTIGLSARFPGKRLVLAALLAAVVIGGGLVGVFAFTGLAERFTSAALDGRIQTAPTILQAAGAFAPWGAGFGSFVPIYNMYEPAAALSPQFLNHAHNDYLELWLEAGVPGMVLAGLVICWAAWRSLAAWLGGGDDLARAGSIIVIALLAHSVVDYPLRTAAMAAIFGIGCGLMAANRPKTPGRSADRRSSPTATLD